MVQTVIPEWPCSMLGHKGPISTTRRAYASYKNLFYLFPMQEQTRPIYKQRFLNPPLWKKTQFKVILFWFLLLLSRVACYKICITNRNQMIYFQFWKLPTTSWILNYIFRISLCFRGLLHLFKSDDCEVIYSPNMCLIVNIFFL